MTKLLSYSAHLDILIEIHQKSSLYATPQCIPYTASKNAPQVATQRAFQNEAQNCMEVQVKVHIKNFLQVLNKAHLKHTFSNRISKNTYRGAVHK